MSEAQPREMLPITSGGEDRMATLCRGLLGFACEDLPTSVVEFAKRHILDTLAVTIGGSSQEGVATVVDLVKAQGGSAESLIPIFGGRVPAAQAGMAIGPMARALDLGDVYHRVGHTAEYVLPCLLGALGTRPSVSGKELIAAFVAGNEALVRIAKGVGDQTPGVAGDQGGYYIFGAVAGTAKLLNLSLDQTLDAMGIVKAMTQPHDLAMYTPATLMKSVHHGLVAHSAITACQLAERGITGPRNVLDGKLGFYQVLTKGTWEATPERVTVGLGDRWLFTQTMFKPYTSCKSTHAGISAIIELMAEANFGPDDIEHIHAEVPQNCWNLNCVPHQLKWNPQTDYDAQFSLPHAIAAAAFNKRFFVEEFKGPTRARQDVRALMEKITASYVPELNEDSYSTRLTVTLRGGRELRKLVSVVKGGPEKPFTRADFEDRARALARYSARKLSDQVVESLIAKVFDLESVEDVTEEIVEPLAPE